MSTYREVHGYTIKSTSSDPDNPQFGQVWYNSSSRQVKVRTTTLASWASGGDLNTARGRIALSSAGTQTAGLCIGGFVPDTKTGNTEEYNGSSWTESGDLNTQRYWLGACGTQTAGLGFGGYTLPGQTVNTEEYNGSSWTESGNLASVRYGHDGCGTQTAAVSMGAGTYSVPQGFARSGVVEEYDGSSWTAGNPIAPALTPSPQSGGGSWACVGTQTAGLTIGGATPGVAAMTQCLEYDGTNFANGGALPSGILNGQGGGIQTSAFICGGQNPAVGSYFTATHLYDGSSWSSSPATLATGTQNGSGAGTTTAGITFGGFKPGSPAYVNETQEFTGEVINTNTFDVS